LESEGLVEIRPRLGASVRSVSGSDFKEMCEVRLALESFAAELAAKNRGADDVVEIQDAFEKMEKLVAAPVRNSDSEKLTEDLVEQDIRFHLAILQAAGNKLMRAEIFRLHLLNRVVRMNVAKLIDNGGLLADDPNQRRQWVLECHRKIFLAIHGRQPELARQAMHEHISDIIDRSILAMARMEKRVAEAAPRSEAVYAPYG